MTTKIAGDTRSSATREIQALPVGAKIRHAAHEHLTGVVDGHEWKVRGILSAIPYRIRWDNEGEARRLLGIFFFWGTEQSIVPA